MSPVRTDAAAGGIGLPLEIPRRGGAVARAVAARAADWEATPRGVGVGRGGEAPRWLPARPEDRSAHNPHRQPTYRASRSASVGGTTVLDVDLRMSTYHLVAGDIPPR